jgi:hypothetical protein
MLKGKVRGNGWVGQCGFIRKREELGVGEAPMIGLTATGARNPYSILTPLRGQWQLNIVGHKGRLDAIISYCETYESAAIGYRGMENGRLKRK